VGEASGSGWLIPRRESFQSIWWSNHVFMYKDSNKKPRRKIGRNFPPTQGTSISKRGNEIN